jgi:hypothetical protein
VTLASNGIWIIGDCNHISILDNIMVCDWGAGNSGVELDDADFCNVINNNLGNWLVDVLVNDASTDCSVLTNSCSNPWGGAPLVNAGVRTRIDGNLGDVDFYQEGDYGVAWAGVAITGVPANGTRVMLHNTNGGCATPNRWYVYSGGAWHYTVLT